MERAFHPIASIFPLLEPDIDALVEDIALNGLLMPIILDTEGRIVDGRNRYRALQRLGQDHVNEYYTTTLLAGTALVQYVVGLNLVRRHLDESQRSMVAARLATMGHGGDRRSDQAANLPLVSQDSAAEMLNVSPRSVRTAKSVQDTGTPELVEAVDQGVVAVSTAVDVATLPAEEQVEIVARGERAILEAAKEIRAQRQEQRREERIALVQTQTQPPQDLASLGRFAVLYADPPWEYEHIVTESRAIENHYPTMALEAICALPIADVAYDDCILFLWATSPMLLQAMEVMQRWGFTYRTCAVWDKERIGMGYFFRQQHELLLVGLKGNLPPPAPENRPGSVLRIRRDPGHSVKPQEVYSMVELMYPSLRKLELFARGAREGWSAWGNQA